MTNADAQEYLDAGLISQSEYDEVIKPRQYQVTNKITGKISIHKTLKSASNACERAAQEYGAWCANYKAI